MGPPPPERPNWSKLNSSQQRYSLEQYNKALRRRNLPPFNLGGVEEDPDLDWDYDGNGDPNDSSATTNSNHVEPSPAPDHSGQYWTGGTETMASTGGSKRSADSSSGGSGSGPAAKKTNTGNALPGTAAANDGDTDTGNPSPENAIIPRPIGNTSGFTMVFRKVHTFISYGCGWKILQHGNTTGAYIGTTSLMNVPVDQPWFYMSPSEFKQLPRGTICTNVKVRGVMRNPRTAFETNSSTSSLATLNQNKFMVKGEGLNLSTRGFNRKLTFGNTAEPMDPTDHENDQQEIKAFITKLYGQDLTGRFTCAAGYGLPASYMNLPLMYNSYFCNFVNTNHNLGRMGWERFNEHITKADASFTIGTTVVDYQYKPKVGLLTLPHDPFFDGCVSVQEPNSVQFNVLGLETGLLTSRDNINANSGLLMRESDNRVIYAGPNCWKNMFENDRYITNIDVGQYLRQMDTHKHSTTVQPSVHVGIYPVHKLTTATNSIVPVNFTDVECTWDFETEMTVSFGCPQSRTAFDRLHVEYEKTWLLENDNYNQNMYNRGDLSIVHGKYVAPMKVSGVASTVPNSGLTKELAKVSTGVKNVTDFTRPEYSTTPAPVSTDNLSTLQTLPPEVATVLDRSARSYRDPSPEPPVLKNSPIQIHDFVNRQEDDASMETLYKIHTLGPPPSDEHKVSTTERSRITTVVEDNYKNPQWWPDPKQFSTYSSFLKFCHDLTLFRRSYNIPIVNEPVDFLRK